MCGIAGFFNPEMDFTKEKVYNLNILDAMNQAQKRRGPDDEGTFLNEHFGLAQVRLAIVDLLTGHQPMLHRSGSRTFGIVYNGELYNTKELRDELKTEGAAFDTDSDTEVLLNAYLAWGTDFISRVNGIFALAIMDTAKPTPSLPGPLRYQAAFLYGLRGDGNRSLCFGTEGAPGLPGYPPRN